MSKQSSLHRIACFLISLAAGIAATLAVDRFENIAVEKEIRKGLEQEIRSAAAAFKESGASPADLLHFLRSFSASGMRGKIIAIDPARDRRPDDTRLTRLFTYVEGSERLEYYIVNSYLNEQLAILNPPELVFGLSTTFIVFAGIVFYSGKKKQALALQQHFEVKQEEIRKVLEEHEALALLGRMAATLAHEMKTPIATISNLVQVDPGRFRDERFTRRFVALTKEELRRTQQLIDNLLAYGKDMEAGKGEWILLSPFLSDVARKNSLQPDIPPLVAIRGDRFYLSLLFDNLFRNCRDSHADKIHVKVADTGEEGSGISIVVEDNGGGFPAEIDLESLLNPFVTFHASGAGLGLYLANKVAAAHGGRISLYRAEEGAGVKITLPRERVSTDGRT